MKKAYQHKETIPMENWKVNLDAERRSKTKRSKVFNLVNTAIRKERDIRRKPFGNTFYFCFGFNVALALCIILFAIYLVFWK